MNSILFVDDDPLTRNGVQALLRRFGYETETVSTIDDAYHRAAATEYALILVDLCLGKDQHGTTLVRQLRALKIAAPIAVYTAFDNEMYEVAAFGAGADDVILKCSSVPRFIARVEALIRRDLRRDEWKPTAKRRLALGRAVLDKEAHVLELDGKTVRLTVKETRILDLLATEPQRIVGAREILKRIWGGNSVASEDAVHAVIKRLRKKLDSECGLHCLIECQHGKGFRIDANVLSHTV